jgi:hypothetical protein
LSEELDLNLNMRVLSILNSDKVLGKKDLRSLGVDRHASILLSASQTGKDYLLEPLMDIISANKMEQGSLSSKPCLLSVFLSQISINGKAEKVVILRHAPEDEKYDITLTTVR